MKKLIVLLLTLALATPALATTTTKIGFRAYSTATPVTCQVFGMGRMANASGTPIQGMAPDSAYSRSYSLGTKGMGNYSTSSVRAAKFTCVNTGTSTAANVKVFLNGVETYFLTLSSDTFVIAP